MSRVLRLRRNKTLTWGLASDRRIWQLPVLAYTGYTRLFPSVQFNHQQGTGVKSRGRSCHSRRRIFGECTPALQAKGAVGRHHQGNQEAQLLHEARGKASSQGSPFTQTPPQKAAARAGLGSSAVWGAVKQCGASQWGEPQEFGRILTSEVACMAACPLPAGSGAAHGIPR
jgi:hypothetical protein